MKPQTVTSGKDFRGMMVKTREATKSAMAFLAAHMNEKQFDASKALGDKILKITRGQPMNEVVLALFVIADANLSEIIAALGDPAPLRIAGREL